MRVTQRDIAQSLGVSTMTVSLALRDHPRISAALRRKVQELARKINYRPDPLFSHLGSMRWKRQRSGFRGILAFINFYPRVTPATNPDYDIFLHAQTIARSLGYELECFPLSKAPSPEALARQLYHRGIEGVLLSRLDSQAFRERFSWDQFATVQCNHGYFEFPCHVVGLERYTEVITAWKKAVETGHRRIGLVLLKEHNATDLDMRVGAMAYCQTQLFPDLPQLPLTWCPGPEAPDAAAKKLQALIRQHRPDALILFNRYFIYLCKAIDPEILKRTSLINLMVTNQRFGETGLFEDFKPVTRAAVHLLDSLLRTGEIGRPNNRQFILLAKQWVEGNTLSVEIKKKPGIARIEFMDDLCPARYRVKGMSGAEARPSAIGRC